MRLEKNNGKPAVIYPTNYNLTMYSSVTLVGSPSQSRELF